MKRILLLAGIINLSLFSAFSQNHKLLKVDTTFQNLSVYKYSRPHLWDGTNNFVNIFKGNKIGNNLSIPHISGKVELYPMIIIDNIKSDDNMPCIKPEGFFSMRIYRPDTKYVLLNR